MFVWVDKVLVAIIVVVVKAVVFIFGSVLVVVGVAVVVLETFDIEDTEVVVFLERL